MTDSYDSNIAPFAQPEVDWRSGLPDDLKSDPSLKDFKDVSALAKSHLELRKLQGNSIRIPGEDSTREDKSKYYSQLLDSGMMPIPNMDNEDEVGNLHKIMGRPDEATGYKFSQPVMDLMDTDVGTFDKVTEVFHKLGITQAQASSLLDACTDKKRLSEMEGEQYQALKTTFGSNTQPMLDKAIQNIKDVVARHPELQQYAKDFRFMYNPGVVQLLNMIKPMKPAEVSSDLPQDLPQGTEAKSEIAVSYSNSKGWGY